MGTVAEPVLAHLSHSAVLTILTNALLQRLAQPQPAFFYQSTVADRKTNEAKACIMLMDACFNGFIDLHSSDRLDHFEAFQKLKGVDKLKRAVGDFRARVAVVALLFDASERERIEETLENVDGFIEYKVDFVRTANAAAAKR
jgi:hypothetical protein